MAINIYERRKELNLTLEEIAKAVGVSKSTVKKWESGYIKNMRRDKIISLSKILSVSPLDILQMGDSSNCLITNSVPLNDEIKNKYYELLKSAFNTDNAKGSAILMINDRLILVDLFKTPHL